MHTHIQKYVKPPHLHFSSIFPQLRWWRGGCWKKTREQVMVLVRNIFSKVYFKNQIDVFSARLLSFWKERVTKKVNLRAAAHHIMDTYKNTHIFIIMRTLKIIFLTMVCTSLVSFAACFFRHTTTSAHHDKPDAKRWTCRAYKILILDGTVSAKNYFLWNIIETGPRIWNWLYFVHQNIPFPSEKYNIKFYFFHTSTPLNFVSSSRLNNCT